MWVGSEFQAAGPATANEPSAKCVLVGRTVKSPRTDDRSRLSLHKSAKYPGAVSWQTSMQKKHKCISVKTHPIQFRRQMTRAAVNE